MKSGLTQVKGGINNRDRSIRYQHRIYGMVNKDCKVEN